MNRLLDWIAEQGNLNEQGDWVKAEVALLVKRTNYNKDILKNLTFEEKIYQNFCDGLFPLMFKRVAFESDRLETNYVKYLLGDLLKKDSYSNYTDDPFLATHSIFFHTDFGKDKKINPEYVSKVKNWSKINYFDKPENGFHLHSYLDWLCQCGLALKCLGADLDQDQIDFISNLEFCEISWETYHVFLVYELYKSI